MGALMAERHDLGRQESLFEGLAPPRANPWAHAPAREDAAAPERDRAERAAEVVADTSGEVARRPSEQAAPEAFAEVRDGAEQREQPQALHGETVRPPETVVGEITIERRTEAAPEPSARRDAAGTLTGPTLDDVVSRMWEGLAIGLPAACPLCHGEVVPGIGGSLSGSCTSCGMTID
jgi:hypothetical protein